MSDKLRLIGTEFEVIRPPDWSSGDLHGHRIRYRVVGHRSTQPTGELIETIECVECVPVDSGWEDEAGK